MQDWMRKHRRLIMFFILIFIGIPFVFMFGMPSPQDRGQQSSQDGAIAQVGGIPLSEAEFRRNLDAAAAMRRGQDGETPSYQQLDEDGTVQRVIENMVDMALFKLQEAQRGFTVNEPLLSNQMQKWEMFQDENGRFNHQAWNEWVGSVTRWSDIYDEMQGAVARQVFLGTVTAPAGRVLEAKIDEELRADHTKLRVKFAKIEPVVVPQDEELLKHYEENPDMYRRPEQHIAEFITLSLAPEMPENALELVERARQGEDFAVLADTYSALSMPEGGEMGWRAEEEFMAAHLRPLFDLLPGEVSDPIAGPTGYFIYKNEEERVNEETGAREIFARQIVLNASLNSTEIEAREQRANELATRIQGGEDPAVVASDAGLELKQSGTFDRTSETIENVDLNDVFQFRSQVVSQKETPWTPIRARNNIYLTHIIETREGDIPEFEEVRDRARENVISDKRRTDEYRAEVEKYTTSIKGQVASLEQINERFPELQVVVGETGEPFTRKDTLFQHQVYVQANLIHDAFKDAAPGTVAGPLSGFFGDAWFFELVEMIQPTSEELAALEDERNEIRERMTQTASYELIADYTKDLRERMLASVPFQQDVAALNRILGRDRTPSQEEPTRVEIGDEVDETEGVEDAANPSEEQAGGEDAEDSAEDGNAVVSDVVDATESNGGDAASSDTPSVEDGAEASEDTP